MSSGLAHGVAEPKLKLFWLVTVDPKGCETFFLIDFSLYWSAAGSFFKTIGDWQLPTMLGSLSIKTVYANKLFLKKMIFNPF
jgi:hypothetical protein